MLLYRRLRLRRPPGAHRRRRRVRTDGVEVTPKAIAERLYLPELPPVDVLVRTSGELRVSNFLLWQSAGAAIHFTGKPWPEFDAAELDAALALARLTGDGEPAPIDRADLSPAALPGAEDRPGQERMAELVAAAIDGGRHLVVQAGTGTGKTLAYLVPAITSGRRTVVATATKALQDQLADQGPPLPRRELATPFEWAVLKGRSNYMCLQRLTRCSRR